MTGHFGNGVAVSWATVPPRVPAVIPSSGARASGPHSGASPANDRTPGPPANVEAPSPWHCRQASPTIGTGAVRVAGPGVRREGVWREH